MIFPDLKGDRFGYVNFNLEAIEWMKKNDIGKHDNPFLDSKKCGVFIAETHNKFAIQHSYGGWLEDRSALWRGSHLDSGARYIHLGVDINVPVGIRVALCQGAYFIRSDTDWPKKSGWGAKVIVKLKDEDIYLMYAHLHKPLYQKPEALLPAGQIIGTVGSSVSNGGWYPHVHVQAIRGGYFLRLRYDNNLDNLCGHGCMNDISFLSHDFPDPMNYISLM